VNNFHEISRAAGLGRQIKMSGFRVDRSILRLYDSRRFKSGTPPSPSRFLEIPMKRSALLVVAVLVLVVSAYPQFKLSSIDFPGGTLTTARGINNHGEIVGAYRLTPPRHALPIKKGNFVPLARTTILGTDYSEAFKINDRGYVVGQIIDAVGFAHGFLLSGGVVTTIDFPGASDTYALGINESGTVVGYWDLVDANGNVLAYHGFICNDGVIAQFDFPGSVDTSLFGVNARGELVGGCTWVTGTAPKSNPLIRLNSRAMA